MASLVSGDEWTKTNSSPVPGVTLTVSVTDLACLQRTLLTVQRDQRRRRVRRPADRPVRGGEGELAGRAAAKVQPVRRHGQSPVRAGRAAEGRRGGRPGRADGLAGQRRRRPGCEAAATASDSVLVTADCWRGWVEDGAPEDRLTLTGRRRRRGRAERSRSPAPRPPQMAGCWPCSRTASRGSRPGRTRR